MVYVNCFGVRVSVMFHFMSVHYTFSSVWVAEWPPFGKYDRSVAFCSHCILSICNIYLFPVLVLRAGFWLLIATVPFNCFSITFTIMVSPRRTLANHVEPARDPCYFNLLIQPGHAGSHREGCQERV